jgi:hypothetical protein
MASVMQAAKGICQECGYAHGAHRTNCSRVFGGHTGYIAHIVLKKGYGFIKVSGRDEELFFNRTDLADGLEFNSQLVERFVRFHLNSLARSWEE